MDTDSKTPEQPKQKQKRTRSPAYPAIDLPTALGRASTLWTKINRHPAAIDSIAGYWDYEKNSSKAMSEASAMIKFGLLSDDGIGEKRTIKLTESGIKLSYNPDTNAAAYLQGLKKAALSPSIHNELWSKYEGILPDDAVIKRHLVVDLKFNEQYVDEFISQFRRTIEFAKLSESDKVNSANENETAKKDAKVNVSLPAVKLAVGNVAVKTTSIDESLKGKNVLATYSIPLGANEATITFSGNILTPEDFDALNEYVDLFKKQFERKMKFQTFSFPVSAKWSNKDFDKSVTITGEIGEKEGQKYYRSEDGTGIPASELKF